MSIRIRGNNDLPDPHDTEAVRAFARKLRDMAYEGKHPYDGLVYALLKIADDTGTQPQVLISSAWVFADLLPTPALGKLMQQHLVLLSMHTAVIEARGGIADAFTLGEREIHRQNVNAALATSAFTMKAYRKMKDALSRGEYPLKPDAKA